MSFHYSALSATGSDDSLNRTRGFIHQDYLDHDANFEDEHGKDHTTKVSSKLPVETNPIILLSILRICIGCSSIIVTLYIIFYRRIV